MTYIHKLTLIAATLILLFISRIATAQERPEIHFSGFVDSYYSFNFNTPAKDANNNYKNSYRYYDTYQNDLTLNLAEITVSAKYKEVSFLTDLDFGPFADLNATTTSVDETSKHIGQAVLTYRPTNSRFSMDIGKMYSHIGIETVKSKDNFNYSRTILFSYGMPFWHTGLRVGYDVIPNELVTNLYIYNGWNTLHDVNQTKTYGAQIKWTPSTNLNVVYNFISGPERPETDGDWKMVHELNSTLVMNDKWTLGVDVLTGSEEGAVSGNKASWSGGLIMAKYLLNEKSFISPRLEVYKDDDGYTLGSGKQTLTSGTFTYSNILTPGLEFRSELRYDKSDEKTFVTDTTSKDSQTTALVALLFTF